MNRRERRAYATTHEGWEPWQRGEGQSSLDPTMIAAATGYSEAEVKAVIADSLTADIWINNIYQVVVRRAEAIEDWPAMIHLSIKRQDRRPIGPERFRDFQRIKNELVGPENEGVELYPAETRLADSANQYHLFVFADPRIRFPFGFRDRLVLGSSAGGAKQQPFPKPVN